MGSYYNQNSPDVRKIIRRGRCALPPVKSGAALRRSALKLLQRGVRMVTVGEMDEVVSHSLMSVQVRPCYEMISVEIRLLSYVMKKFSS